jgi:hypothetical protein
LVINILKIRLGIRGIFFYIGKNCIENLGKELNCQKRYGARSKHILQNQRCYKDGNESYRASFIKNGIKY